jgi:hypothetical protein
LGDIVQRAAMRRAEAAEILPALEELLATKPQVIASSMKANLSSRRILLLGVWWEMLRGARLAGGVF